MDKLNVTSSQSGAREELVQEDIWDETEEDIWAEIFHDDSETVLRNISSSNSSKSERKLQIIDFEDMYLEVTVTLNNASDKSMIPGFLPLGMLMRGERGVFKTNSNRNRATLSGLSRLTCSPLYRMKKIQDPNIKK